MKDLLREIQLGDLGEVPLEDLEEEMEEDSIPKALWKGMRDIGRKRNGQVPQVIGERGEIFPSPPPQLVDYTKGPLPLLPHPRIDFLWTGVVLEQGLSFKDTTPKYFGGRKRT